MTKSANKFAKAIAACADRVASATNKKKAAQIAVIATNKDVAAMLTAQKVDVTRFNARALYATEKVVKATHALTRETFDASAMNANAHATIRSAILALKTDDKTLTKSDIRAALSKDVALDASRKSRVFRRNNLLSAATLNAQSQQCFDMLLTLNVAKVKTKDSFEIVDCEFLQNAIAKFDNAASAA